MKLALAPVGDAMTTFLALGEAEDVARARIGDVDAQARRAAAELAESREALIQLEAGAPTVQERAAAEKRLARAEQTAGERWPERHAGAERGALDARHALQRFAAEHLDELVNEVEEAGAAAAEQVNHAAGLFLRSLERRDQIERDLISIVALTRMMKPGDTNRSNADDARRAVQTLLQNGGEVGPELVVRDLVSA
jgi:hypothetical protein